jgi:hypothetical protein
VRFAPTTSVEANILTRLVFVTNSCGQTKQFAVLAVSMSSKTPTVTPFVCHDDERKEHLLFFELWKCFPAPRETNGRKGSCSGLFFCDRMSVSLCCSTSDAPVPDNVSVGPPVFAQKTQQRRKKKECGDAILVRLWHLRTNGDMQPLLQ